MAQANQSVDDLLIRPLATQWCALWIHAFKDVDYGALEPKIHQNPLSCCFAELGFQQFIDLSSTRKKRNIQCCLMIHLSRSLTSFAKSKQVDVGFDVPIRFSPVNVSCHRTRRRKESESLQEIVEIAWLHDRAGCQKPGSVLVSWKQWNTLRCLKSMFSCRFLMIFVAELILYAEYIKTEVYILQFIFGRFWGIKPCMLPVGSSCKYKDLRWDDDKQHDRSREEFCNSRQ